MGIPAIKIRRSKDGKFYFVVVAANGEPVATSETYESKQACKDTAYALPNIAYSAEVIDETI